MLLLAGFTLAMANFMAVLDTTIVNVSVPNIAGGLAVSPSQGTWVITSYAVAEAITVPLTGWLAGRFGAVKVFTSAMIGFGIFSALCGLAPTLGALVVFRVLQGLCGGPMIPLSQTLLLRVFPKEKANAAIGLWSMTTVVGPIAGPILGGHLSDNAGWEWIFYINVPFTILFAFLATRILSGSETKILKRPVDVVGLGLLVLWVGSMQIMLDKGKELDWFASPTIVALAIAAVVGFIAFLIWELTEKNPIVDLKVFRFRSFAIGTAVLSLTFGTFFSSVVLLPLWLQTNMGYTASWAGYATALTGVMAVVMSPVVAKLAGKIDARALISFGVAILALVGYVRTGFTTEATFWSISWPQLLQGFGMPFFFIPTMKLALAQLPPEDIASGSGFVNFARTTSGAFATSIVTTQWDNAANVNRWNLVGKLNDPDGAIARLTGMGFSHDQALKQLEGLVSSQSVMLATNQLFLITAIAFAIAAAVVWAAPKVDTSSGPVPAH